MTTPTSRNPPRIHGLSHPTPPEVHIKEVVPWFIDCKDFIERELGRNQARRITDTFGEIPSMTEEAGWDPTGVYNRLYNVASYLEDLADKITQDDLATQLGPRK